MTDTIICTVCPLGCSLIVEHKNKTIQSISGNRCKRGIAYGEQEILDPKRVVTTTVKIDGGIIPMLSVKTSAPVERGKMTEIVRSASQMRLHAPVEIGTVIEKNICSSGADLIATRNVAKISDSAC
ncbi:MAG: DUF1667 domain-containing protein [Spirochaetales bacterium]|nr:DUF1667 domain-containing protein [Spirochaetales bacterium]